MPIKKRLTNNYNGYGIMSNIQIGKAIQAILAQTDIYQLVNGNISPLIAKEQTPFPYIIYKRAAAQDTLSKDSRYQETSTVDIAIISDNYNTSIEIADKVKETLSFTKGMYGGFNIIRIRPQSTDEAYYAGAFIQTIKFIITTEYGNS